MIGDECFTDFGEADWTAYLVDRVTGVEMPLERTGWRGTAERVYNQVSTAQIVLDLEYARSMERRPILWMNELVLRRDGELAWVGPITNIIDDDTVIWEARDRMEFVMSRRVWWRSFYAAGEATFLFEACLDAADYTDEIGLVRDRRPNGVVQSLEHTAGDKIESSINKLTNVMDWSVLGDTVRFGNIQVVAERPLPETAWRDRPMIEADGYLPLSHVIASTTNRGRVFYPSHRPAERPENTPLLVDTIDVGDIGLPEATRIARELWLNRQGELVIESVRELELDSQFPLAFKDLIPGAVLFSTARGTVLYAEHAPVRMDTVVFELADSKENAVTSTLVEAPGFGGKDSDIPEWDPNKWPGYLQPGGSDFPGYDDLNWDDFTDPEFPPGSVFPPFPPTPPWKPGPGFVPDCPEILKDRNGEYVLEPDKDGTMIRITIRRGEDWDPLDDTPKSRTDRIFKVYYKRDANGNLVVARQVEICKKTKYPGDGEFPKPTYPTYPPPTAGPGITPPNYENCPPSYCCTVCGGLPGLPTFGIPTLPTLPTLPGLPGFGDALGPCDKFAYGLKTFDACAYGSSPPDSLTKTYSIASASSENQARNPRAPDEELMFWQEIPYLFTGPECAPRARGHAVQHLDTCTAGVVKDTVIECTGSIFTEPKRYAARKGVCWDIDGAVHSYWHLRGGDNPDNNTDYNLSRHLVNGADVLTADPPAHQTDAVFNPTHSHDLVSSNDGSVWMFRRNFENTVRVFSKIWEAPTGVPGYALPEGWGPSNTLLQDVSHNVNFIETMIAVPQGAGYWISVSSFTKRSVLFMSTGPEVASTIVLDAINKTNGTLVQGLISHYRPNGDVVIGQGGTFGIRNGAITQVTSDCDDLPGSQSLPTGWRRYEPIVVSNRGASQYWQLVRNTGLSPIGVGFIRGTAG